MRFSTVRPVKAAQQVAAALRDAIVSGDLRPGDDLPSERQMAEEFSVNRSTVREALQNLEAWGLVRIRQGGSTTVQDVLSSAGLHLLPFLIAPRGAPDPALIADLLQMRVMILSWTARWAAQAGGDTTPLAELAAALEAGDPGSDLAELDFAFFEALIALSGNRVLGMLAALVREVYFQHRSLFAPLYAPGVFDPAFHRRALQAVQARDPEAAAAAMASYAQRAADLGKLWAAAANTQGGKP